MSVLSAAELASSATAIFPSASRASPVTLSSSGFLTALVNSPPALSRPATASWQFLRTCDHLVIFAVDNLRE
ncbi:hypothetical protein ABZ093_05810 [Streptomyces cyaneofuscatus]|uniref:hypothetical protein n=1 Tax=Streptomyces cyaneofuscatus TaxID=66883 RepID=UPI0033A5C302